MIGSIEMRIFEDAWLRDDLPRGAVVTIGNFDGLHVGQRTLLDRIQQRARERRSPAIVVTFEPHPLRVLRPERAPLRLTTLEQKLALLEEAGIEAVVLLRFTPELARVSAVSFIDDFLRRRMGITEIHVGSRFSFGRDREGTLDLLIEQGDAAGFSAHGVPEVLHDGLPVSSTRVRDALAAGEVEEAGRMLGRAFAVIGTVAGGESRGRSLGWPTANLEVDNELFPRNGVYVTEVRLDGDTSGRISVTNVGVRPTFDNGTERTIESHLLDFEGDLYGQRLELRFRRRLRGEQRFDSSDDLIAQIEEDVRKTREYFAANSC